MPAPQRRFTQEFRDEAVRPCETSGRTRRAVAENLGSGRRRFVTGSTAAAIGRWSSLPTAARRTRPPS